ncbi:MAG TPA: VWA domain-containing protein [Pyrinomonadaceae bacterium]|jgi:Ca-activated chloride channel family protein
MKARPLFVLIFFLFSTLCAVGQTPTLNKEEVIKVNTQLVEVPVVITDRSGRPILNLKQSNFAVYEDGNPQEILDFSNSSAPFEVALLLDTSGSTRSDLQLIQHSAENFINSLRPGDRVAIIAFNQGTRDSGAPAVIEIVSPLTDDRAALRNALQRVATSNGTPYYDSLVQVADKVFGTAPTEEFRGRRALVALTDGVDSTSVSDFDEAQEKLEKRGLISFFIQVNTRPFFEDNLLGDCATALHFSPAQIRRYYKSFGAGANIERTDDFCKLGDFERLAISKKLYEIADGEMGRLAKTSGGKVFPAADLSEARAAFKNVADEIGTKYSLGYYSTNEKRDGTYRKIRVELKSAPPGSVVRAREGYTAPTN